MRPSTPLSAALPPLIMGTATFNNQYNADPFALPTTELVQRALSRGIRAFDTSPYYGRNGSDTACNAACNACTQTTWT